MSSREDFTEDVLLDLVLTGDKTLFREQGGIPGRRKHMSKDTEASHTHI
jgi:hypothetical protein